jgi:hypothetical protein
LAVGAEFKTALVSLRAKYEKVKDQLEEAQGHEMHIG